MRHPKFHHAVRRLALFAFGAKPTMTIATTSIPDQNGEGATP